MRFKKYRIIGVLLAIFIANNTQAQKHDKKYSEHFKVNKDVELVINATNADINVTTWNKNEVLVEAKITVEGLTKKEAEKYLKNWKFEALGNKRKVEINAKGNGFRHFENFEFDFSNITIPEIDISFPDIDFSDFEMPEINLDFDEILSDIDTSDFEEGANNTFTFKSKGKIKKVIIKSEKEWKKFKKSPEYKEMKSDVKRNLKKAKAEIKKIDKRKIEAQIKKAKIRFEKIDKAKIKAQLKKARAVIKKMKMDNSYKNGESIFEMENNKSNKKVKITRTITIKVPKNATYKLNTRYSKVKLPKGKVSGKVSYGAFTADELNGGNLKIYYAPVDIKTLNKSIVSLNNVTDANIASVSNTKLISNSSGLTIAKIYNNVDLTSKFGELLISEVVADLKGFKLNLNFSDATINLKNLKGNIDILYTDNVKSNKNISKSIILSGNFSAKNNNLDIKGKQSKITIKRQ